MPYHDETLLLLQEQMAEKSRLEAKRKVLKNQESQMISELKDLEQIKIREESDVEALSRRSLASFYYQVIGKKDAMLSKEKEEAYAAQVKYDAVLHSLDEIKKEISAVGSALLPLRDCERRYEKAIAEKKEKIIDSESSAAQKITQLEALIQHLNVQEREITEAITSGEQAISIAETILTGLDRAESLGTWDLLGGGMITDIAKHSQLDEAQMNVERLQSALHRFKAELADVKLQADMQVNVEGFMRFADYFFDGLFADWTVLGHIKDSRMQVYETKKKLLDTVKKLRNMHDNTVRERNNAAAQCTELIRTTIV